MGLDTVTKGIQVKRLLEKIGTIDPTWETWETKLENGTIIATANRGYGWSTWERYSDLRGRMHLRATTQREAFQHHLEMLRERNAEIPEEARARCVAILLGCPEP